MISCPLSFRGCVGLWEFERTRASSFPCLNRCKNLGLQSKSALSNPNRPQGALNPDLKHCKDSGFEPSVRSCLSLSAFCLLPSAVCTATLFFPLSAAFFPQGFCTEKVFNEVCHFSVQYHCHCLMSASSSSSIGITVEGCVK